MIAADFEKSILALTVWRLVESDGGLDEMLAVACCLANKVKVKKKSWMDMIWEEDGCRDGYPDTREPGFLRLLQSIDAIYDGRARDITNGATSFCVLGETPAPSNMALCARVGRWSFFK